MKIIRMLLPLGLLILKLSGNKLVLGDEIRVGGVTSTNNILESIKEASERQTGIRPILLKIGPRAATEDPLKKSPDVACIGMIFEERAELTKKEANLTLKRCILSFTKISSLKFYKKDGETLYST